MFTSVKDIVNAPSAKKGIGVITVPDIRWSGETSRAWRCWRRFGKQAARQPVPAKPG